ncbi:LysE/ArgO family amino acid transporter [Duganella violaceipulchra]|uniref:L-lysine exporter family protein LysE/ArgO n=1 Tax=Duganella violaceipulchra TaxID=2849652 RepID=A0AA41KZF7_9BURK|nr:LysE/ArgO family amino acid transporter [Duganella violaceicalia]MBV6320411.1 LysE/ArgO family amino acid transporter [Duganella violaceicalia]MCP2012246.1 L-lysine exporter family protein LysE/ArgO [Duganella violaceicalia]
MEATAFLKGIGLGGSLIVAIGSQNAYLLRQALKREFVLTCIAICVICDVVLIGAGVAGMGQLITQAPTLLFWIKIAGAGFLFWYGLRAARSALNPGAMEAGDSTPVSDRRTVIAAMLAFSLLNPHVYLDTVVLLGSIGGQQAGNGRLYFALGAMLASLLWFGSLGLGARYLTPVFAKQRAWQILDGVIALVMWGLAISLFA